MGAMFADSLFLPAFGLALLGWIVPRVLARFWPEGVRPLLLLAFCATLLMFLAGAAFFLALYLMQGVTLARLFEPGVGATLWHFGRLSLVSALLWGPILILSVAGLPRRWKTATW